MTVVGEQLTLNGSGFGSLVTAGNLVQSRGALAVHRGRQHLGRQHRGRAQRRLSGATTNGSNAITGLSSTSSLFVGMAVSGTGIPAGTTIAGITSGSAITISANATAGGTPSLTFTSDVVINTNNVTATVNGVISGNNLVKLGSNNLTLIGANTFTGNIAVNAGGLVLGQRERVLRHSDGGRRRCRLLHLERLRHHAELTQHHDGPGTR